jgi:hypothetical protein
VYLQDQSWRGLGALPPCGATPPGFVGPVECDPSNPNQTTLLDPFGIYAMDTGNATGTVNLRPPAAAQSFGAWLQQNAITVGIGISMAALFIGLARR